MATFQELEAEIIRLREALSKQDDEICQTLGKALGYPWYKDDQKNFPGATEEHGVCVGDHVAESLAMEAAAGLVDYKVLLKQLDGLTVTLTDDPAGVAYVSFLPEPRPRGVSVRQTELPGSGLILDWNKDNQLIGIEFLNTSRFPPREGRTDEPRNDG
jgi:hypothetical protein